MPSIYDLKPRFQQLLRPLTAGLAKAGVTANQVTLIACLGSAALGAYLSLAATPLSHMLALPVFLFIRMALNAIDGMLAREFAQKSNLGAYLNEMTDVVSDAALYLPFHKVLGFPETAAIIFLAALTEMAGVLGVAVGAGRHYEGPMGKSDRAFCFGALGLYLGLGGALSGVASAMISSAMLLLLILTVVHRIHAGLKESR